MWARQFVAIPSSRLCLSEPVKGTDKATPSQLRAYANSVTGVYAGLRAGVTPAQFEAAYTTESAAVSRDLAVTYHHLFSPTGVDGRIEADYIDGALVVTRGRHRVDAAQQLGVPVLPVHVRAQNAEVLSGVIREFDSRLATSDPDIVGIQRDLDEQHHLAREHRTPDLAQSATRGEKMSSMESGPRKSSPEFEKQPHEKIVPDRDRAARALGAAATAQQVQTPEASNRSRVERALGRTATEAVRAPSRDRS